MYFHTPHRSLLHIYVLNIHSTNKGHSIYISSHSYSTHKKTLIHDV